MKKEEMSRAELIREEVRRFINQVLDEEFDAVLKEVEEERAMLESRDIDSIIKAKLSETAENNISTDSNEQQE